jgi:pimeloyl-ACP methyl ester carboxylesterase
LYKGIGREEKDKEVVVSRWLLFIACLLLAAASVLGASPTQVKEEKSLILDDSLKLWAELTHDTTMDHQPVVILLHMLGHDHNSFQPFVDALFKEAALDTRHRTPPAVLNLDLRGHGRSILRGLVSLNYETMTKEEFQKIPGDIRALVTHLQEDSTLGLDWSNVTVIGASIGANSAALVSKTVPGIRRLVLLSPGLSYHGLEPADALRGFAGKALVYSSKGDEYARDSSQKLADANKAHVTLRWFGADQHGTDIINDDKAAMADLVRWILSE